MERIAKSPDATAPEQSLKRRAWYVRAFREADEPSLLDLYREVFGRTRGVEQMRWKLLARNDWPGQMVWVAVERGSERIVGHYAGIPLEIMIHGQCYSAIHSVEAMAHPHFRRQGILTALGGRAHDEWTSAGYVMVIGLPNDKWGTRNAALGYVPLFPLAWLRFPMRLDRIALRHFTARAARTIATGPARLISLGWRRVHLGGGLNSAHVQVTAADLSSTPGDVVGVWPLLSVYFPNAVVRSPGWLRWRYGGEPSHGFRVLSSAIEGRPTGYAAYRVIEDGERRTGYLADLVVAPDDRKSARALLACVFADLDRAGAGSVMAASPPGSVAYKQLADCGFRAIGAGFTFEIVPLAAQIKPDALKDPARWHLAAGDFDIV